MKFRKATPEDLPTITGIYSDILTEQEQGNAFVGWVRGVYPTEQTARIALQRGDLFVQEENGVVIGAAIINRQQVDVYGQGNWQYPAGEEQVMVLHTLVIVPKAARKGYGAAFVRFYEQYALENGCAYLRMDTNAGNTRARAMYRKLGYAEIGVVPCVFNGIEGVPLVLLEKYLG